MKSYYLLASSFFLCSSEANISVQIRERTYFNEFLQTQLHISAMQGDIRTAIFFLCTPGNEELLEHRDLFDYTARDYATLYNNHNMQRFFIRAYEYGKVIVTFQTGRKK